jgi:hypothetical protein
VSRLYEGFSCVGNKESSVVVLDVEATFPKNESGKLDSIDIVLLDRDSKKIRFVEAKHYSYKGSLRSKSGKYPVVTQMNRYAERIRENQDAILNAYKNHVQALNALFETSIPEPASVDPDPVVLLVFGFDEEQSVYLEENIKKPVKSAVKSIYCIGDITDCDVKALMAQK